MYVYPIRNDIDIALFCAFPRQLHKVNMAATKVKEKEPTNIVHQNAIFCETVHKEQRHQKLYTNYGLNPYKKGKRILGAASLSYLFFAFPTVHAVTGKPYSQHDSGDGKGLAWHAVGFGGASAVS